MARNGQYRVRCPIVCSSAIAVIIDRMVFRLLSAKSAFRNCPLLGNATIIFYSIQCLNTTRKKTAFCSPVYFIRQSCDSTSHTHITIFVTGDSSLQYLPIVRTIIAMAKSLRPGIITEGVKTEAQLQFLTNEGCSHFHGYLFNKQAPLEQFEALLKHI